MKEPRVFDVPFSLAPTRQLIDVARGEIIGVPDPGDLPDAVEIGKIIAERYAKERICGSGG